MVFIYVLRLKDEKYYVGKTDNPDIRIADHFSCDGSAWTDKYKPLEVVEVIRDCHDEDEDKYTLKYMREKGLKNVRGGSFSSITLMPEHVNTIAHMINGANDNCFICGDSSHFAGDCKNRNQNKKRSRPVNFVKSTSSSSLSSSIHKKAREEVIYISDDDDNDDDTFDILYEEGRCFRCFRAGHYGSECYALTCDPNILKDLKSIAPIVTTKEERCKKCGRESHIAVDCYATIHANGYQLKDLSVLVQTSSSKTPTRENAVHTREMFISLSKACSNKQCCNKCGRDSHLSNSCYATTHADGYTLLNSSSKSDRYSSSFSPFPSSNSRGNSNMHRQSTVEEILFPRGQGKKKQGCYRCGRDTHHSSSCYATTHVDGGRIY